MALNEITFTIKQDQEVKSIPVAWAHNGVVGSGDLEVLMQRADNGGAVQVKIVTPLTGYEALWEKVLHKFVTDAQLGNVNIEINDNNATPYVVAVRLKQGLLEAKAGDDE